MKALITGASSGIGRDMAIVLANMGVDLVLVARRGERLQQLKEALPVHVEIFCVDISEKENCFALYQRVKDDNINILINNAGFGDFGEFKKTSLDKDLQMIKTNIQAVHILTKLFLKDFVKKDDGYILNVASSAAFLPGPLMATYYATKSYVLRLSMAISKEFKKRRSNVSISILCPGPVQTEFNNVANVNFLMNGKKSEDVANQAISRMFMKKLLIIPGALMKTSYYLTKILPNNIQMEFSYRIQHRKNK
ncbi:MAG: SDR family NAD(P)-dependent oxidoreductase [Longicatena sp.]